MKNGRGHDKRVSPPRADVAKALSISLGAGIEDDGAATPSRASRGLQRLVDSAPEVGMFGSTSTRNRVAPGTSSCSSSSRFAANSHVEEADAGDVAARPVEAGNKAVSTGSPPPTNTIGIVVVAALRRQRRGVCRPRSRRPVGDEFSGQRRQPS